MKKYSNPDPHHRTKQVWDFTPSADDYVKQVEINTKLALVADETHARLTLECVGPFVFETVRSPRHQSWRLKGTYLLPVYFSNIAEAEKYVDDMIDNDKLPSPKNDFEDYKIASLPNSFVVHMNFDIIYSYYRTSKPKKHTSGYDSRFLWKKRS